MIKFFQKLKAKKGFTLVELIVVIAIIGVLAAILIPTMMGYVTSSRVTSVNTTAANIKSNVDTFLTECDTAGYGMKLGNTNTSTFAVTVDTTGKWSLTGGTTTAFKTGGTKTWGATGASDQNKVTTTNATDLLAIRLQELLPEVKSASAIIYVEGGKCKAVAYTEDTNAGITVGTDCPGITAGTGFPASYTWNNATAGVNSNGLIVGTAPAVPLGSGS